METIGLKVQHSEPLGTAKNILGWSVVGLKMAKSGLHVAGGADTTEYDEAPELGPERCAAN